MTNIDDMFSHTSMEAARLLIGMQIQAQNGLYTVSATKAYYGDSRQVQNKPRLRHGGIMMFNLRGHHHFCIATGQGSNQDYILVARVLDGDKELKSAKAVSEILGLDMDSDGRAFADYFTLAGQTAPSRFTRNPNDASSCLGMYELIR